mmetsp:Transcript_28067/g.89214  ORF Transcript_28067/g.89214 Transcript_28067/m.89214 type:complete len:411 (+) Transcript_28067:45-1277(+)
MWDGLSLACLPRAAGSAQVDVNEESVVAMSCLRSAAASNCCAGLNRFCHERTQSSTRIAVAVMRHGERLDAVDPKSWYNSAAGKRYPFDCPLSANGRREVGDVARELAHSCKSGFSYVVTSPFVRCVETAVEVCRALKLPICIDRQLGEVFGPACFGEWSAPGPARRSPEEVAAFVPPDLRSTAAVDSIGQEPSWPESIEDARLRMVSRVEQYTEWAARLDGVNFVLVTHGDCVGACLTLALARTDGRLSHVVEKVGYCGYALLERTVDPARPVAALGLMDEAANWRVRYGHVALREMGLISDLEAVIESPEEDHHSEVAVLTALQHARPKESGRKRRQPSKVVLTSGTLPRATPRRSPGRKDADVQRCDLLYRLHPGQVEDQENLDPETGTRAGGFQNQCNTAEGLLGI